MDQQMLIGNAKDVEYQAEVADDYMAYKIGRASCRERV